MITCFSSETSSLTSLMQHTANIFTQSIDHFTIMEVKWLANCNICWLHTWVFKTLVHVFLLSVVYFALWFLVLQTHSRSFAHTHTHTRLSQSLLWLLSENTHVHAWPPSADTIAAREGREGGRVSSVTRPCEVDDFGSGLRLDEEPFGRFQSRLLLQRWEWLPRWDASSGEDDEPDRLPSSWDWVEVEGRWGSWDVEGDSALLWGHWATMCVTLWQ